MSLEHGDVRSEGAGQFHAHVPETINTDNADFLAGLQGRNIPRYFPVEAGFANPEIYNPSFGE